jgi:hypothetical protein
MQDITWIVEMKICTAFVQPFWSQRLLVLDLVYKETLIPLTSRKTSSLKK